MMVHVRITVAWLGLLIVGAALSFEIGQDEASLSLIQTAAGRIASGNGIQASLKETDSLSRSVWNSNIVEGDNDVTVDMNGRPCSQCVLPLPERSDRPYVQRTDCGKQLVNEHPENEFVPLIEFSQPAKDGSPETSAYCELNAQKVCADGMYNRDFLMMAKASDDDQDVVEFDKLYCHYNGFMAPEFVALQHDFDAMKAKAAAVCAEPKYLTYGWNSTLTMHEFSGKFIRTKMRGYPTPDDAHFILAWTCAMGSSGCDIAYCAYSFCDKGNGNIGRYGECEGWDPVKGMPIPSNF